MKTSYRNLTSLFVLAATGCVAAGCGADDVASDDVASQGREHLATVRDAAPRVVMTRSDFEATEQVDVATLAKNDNGDGTWSYALPEGFDSTIALEGRVLTWRYAGQARFSHDPKPPMSTRYHVVQPDVPTDHDAQLAGMTRLDALGRLWKVEAVDRARWVELSAPDPVEREGDQPEVLTRELEPDAAPGTVIPWQPTSWDHLNCDGQWGKDVHIWDGDGRTAKTGSLTARQATAVRVRTDLGNETGKCSGVILRQDQMLTAAHCVSDDNNNPVPIGDVEVCREDTGQCRDAADIDFSPSYGGGSGDGGGTDFADDWAIIELSGSWTSTAEDMDLSSASDTTIGNLTKVHNLGFPGFAPSCTDQGGETLFHNVENEPVAGIKNKKLKLKIDGSPGQSGGPIYYCPEGDNNVCGAGEHGFVLAVFAGWNSVDKRYVGPKSPNFKSEAIAFMND